MALDMDKLNAFIGGFVGDLGATVHAGMVVIGDKLGLYKALAVEPMTSGELAAKTSTDERYVREWLASQAAGGYVTYDPAANKFSMSEEQAFTLANEDSPAYLPGAFELALGSLASVPRLTEAFRTGAGMGWHEHAEGVFHGCEKFFRPGYAANLVSAWIPALEGVQAKLEAGGRVADIGCGKGSSTILMAQAFPKSTFAGFDYHDESIAGARAAAERQGVGDRADFQVVDSKGFPGKDYDLVTVFDSLHDMGDPVGGGGACAGFAEEGWHLDDRGAVCERRVERQPESRGADLLLVLDAAVYAVFALAGRGALPGGAIGRETDRRGGEGGGLHQVSESKRDAVQYCL